MKERMTEGAPSTVEVSSLTIVMGEAKEDDGENSAKETTANTLNRKVVLFFMVPSCYHGNMRGKTMQAKRAVA
jgi:hypothetical protein